VTSSRGASSDSRSATAATVSPDAASTSLKGDPPERQRSGRSRWHDGEGGGGVAAPAEGPPGIDLLQRSPNANIGRSPGDCRWICSLATAAGCHRPRPIDAEAHRSDEESQRSSHAERPARRPGLVAAAAVDGEWPVLRRGPSSACRAMHARVAMRVPTLLRWLWHRDPADHGRTGSRGPGDVSGVRVFEAGGEQRQVPCRKEGGPRRLGRPPQ
jgi:hypothetical protein